MSIEKRRSTSHPLTNSQLGIYLECLDKDKNNGYLMPLTFHFPKDKIDANKLSEAFHTVSLTYSAFSTVIRTEGSQPVMLLTNEELPYLQIADTSEADAEKCRKELLINFSFDGSLLWRGKIYRTEKEIILALVLHHTIFDGTSIAVLNKALAAAYVGEALPSEDGTVFDFQTAEEKMLRSGTAADAAAFFENCFDGYESDSNIRPDKVSEGKRIPASVIYPVNLTENLIKTFASENEVNENTVFLSAFTFALAKFNNQNESVFSSVESGRFGGGYENSIGMFVKSFPLRFTVDEQLSSADFVKGIKKRYFDTLTHNHTDYMKLVKSYPGCADVEFIYQGKILKTFPVNGADTVIDILDTYEAVSNFNVLVFKDDGRYRIWTGYDSSMYTKELIDCFAELYVTVLSELLSGKKLCEFNLVSRKSRDFIDESNRTEKENASCLTVNRLFENAVSEYPERTAVSFENRKITYRELGKLTHSLASYINSKGLGKEDFIPILIPRNEYMPICALGVILSGAAYQPLDPAYPEERLNFMVSDSHARLLIADRRLVHLVGEYHGEIIYTDEIETLPDINDEKKEHNSPAASPCSEVCVNGVLPDSAPEDAALLIYTSGTTGTPKGCILENRNIAGFYFNHRKNVELSENSKVATIASFGFDAAAMDIFTTLLCGAELCIIPDEIKLDIPEVEKFYVEHGITNGFMTTQLGRMFLSQTKCMTLRHFVLGGEKLVPFTPPEWVVCHNDYGPSEALAYICGFVIKDDSLIQPIGTPSDNTKLYITDANNRLLPPGACGELCIAGVQVGRAYLNRPEKTAEAFIENPFCDSPAYRRLYKTGDIVRMLPDGNYDYVGRRDGQVKIRGFRVELTEIEQVIRDYPGIRNASVQAFDDTASGKYLAAFVVSDTPVDITDFNEFIMNRKPAYMVPAVTVQLDNIPVNANGKVDKRKLPKPEMRFDTAVKPETPSQQKIFDAVSQILGTDGFGIDTDLYLCGLSSIGCIRLCAALAENFGTPVQMKDIRNNSTVRKLDSFLSSVPRSSVQKHIAQKDYPLTKTQEGILVECISKPESTFYNIPLLLEISSEIDTDKLKHAIVKTVKAHPYLETELFTDKTGTVRQRRKSPSVFSEADIETVTEKSREEILRNAVTPFALTGSRLFRFRIYRGESTYLFFEIHHIIADGTSINVLMRDVQLAYKGETPENEEYDSFDLALDEAEKRNSSLLDEAENHFRQLLDGLDMNYLPGADRLPAAMRSSGVYSSYETLASAGKAAEFCSANNLSLNSMLCSAFGFLLAKYAGTEYSVFNTVYNGRNDSRTASTVGMLVKTLPVVCRIDRDNSLDIAKDVTAQLIDSMSNDLYSFAEICRNFGVKNDVIFVFQGNSFSFDSFCGKKSQKIDAELSESKMPLSIQTLIENGRFRYIAEYDTNLYTEAFISTFLTVFDKVISCFVSGERVADISLLTPELTAALDETNRTEFPYDTTKTITDYYAEQVKRNPGKCAVVNKDKTYTFGNAYDISCRIAAFLVKKGIKRGDIVAILIPRDETMLLSAHGVIMSGAAYLGLDPSYPSERLNFMLEDCSARLVIANRSLEGLIDGYKGDILYTDEFDSLPEAADFNYAEYVSPDNIALVVYSSGTTGVPKGALLCHKNIVCFYQNYTHDMEIAEGSHIAMYASFGFDGGAMDIFCSPMAGATLHIIPDDIRLDLEKLEQFYVQNRISSGFMTTQVGSMFIRNTQCKTLKHFQVGGEKLIPALPPEWITFGNGYGPSETMCYVNNYTITDTGNLQPIGKPNRNIKEYVIDKFGHRLPFGACGELCISGGQTGLGYLNRPEKTAQAFVDNPFCKVKPYDRMYRTGDIVRQLPDGNYVFEGRRDGQVKIRGFRVELSEIEQIIRDYPPVRNAAVQAFDSPAGGKYIAAYVTSDEKVDINGLNSFISSKKPDYMVPAVTVQIDEIPLTANGKIDKRKLPAPAMTNSKKGAEPANETEEALCGIFRDVLGLDKVYADDDFFMIGGSSISAIQVVVKCNNAGFEIVFKNLFANPTPHSLSEFILGRRETSAYAPDEKESERYDYSALQYNTVENVDEITSGDIGDVLLTGSTGFLGSHILKELLDNTSSRVICLVRSKEGMDAATRLQMMMTYYFEDWYGKDKSSRVTLIDGELGDLKAMKQLEALHFDTIINSAANVKHFAAGDELLKDNYSAVENLIELAEKTGTLLVQISSTSVSGEAVEGKVSDDFMFRECNLNIGQSLENKYVYSKYQAEQAIIDAISRNRIKGKIIRLGNLMARFDDSEFQINARSNGFLKQFAGYKKLGMFSVSQLDKEIEFSPIDATARAVVLLSGTPLKFTVFHAKNCNTIHYGYLIRAMQKEGIDIRIVNDDVFADTVKQHLLKEKEVLELSSLIAYRDNTRAGEAEKIMHQIESDATFTTKALYRLGFAWPLISSDYLENMVQTLIALGFFA